MAEALRYMDLRRWRAMDQMIDNPYHIEGIKIWGEMQNWYKMKMVPQNWFMVQMMLTFLHLKEVCIYGHMKKFQLPWCMMDIDGLCSLFATYRHSTFSYYRNRRKNNIYIADISKPRVA